MVAFVVSRVAATGLAEVIELLHSKSFFRKHGIWITASERSFFHAYRLLADRVGVTRSLEVADAEMEPEQWQAVYEDLTIKWPVVTARFTPD